MLVRLFSTCGQGCCATYSSEHLRPAVIIVSSRVSHCSTPGWRSQWYCPAGETVELLTGNLAGAFSMQASSTSARAQRCCSAARLPHCLMQTCHCGSQSVGRSPAVGTTRVSSAVPIAGNVLCGAARPAGTVGAGSRRALPDSYAEVDMPRMQRNDVASVCTADKEASTPHRRRPAAARRAHPSLP